MSAPHNLSVAQTIIDISLPVFPGMPIYPGDPPIEFERAASIANGDIVNATQIHIGSHTGTHFDTPHHILNNGLMAEDIPLDRCYGPALVVEIPEEIQVIDDRILESFDLRHCRRLLLKTGNSRLWQSDPCCFVENYVALAPEAAEYLVQSTDVQLVGIDYLSIEPFGSSNLQTHAILLQENITLLEGLNLQAVSPGWYTLAAFPIRFRGLDGALTRAVLLK